MTGANTQYTVGYFATKKEAARAYDAEVRRRGWTHIKRLNFPGTAGEAALPPSSTAGAAPGPEGALPSSSAAAAAPGPD